MLTFRERTRRRQLASKLRSEEGKLARLMQAETVMRDYEAAHWATHRRGVTLTYSHGMIAGATDAPVSVRKLRLLAQQLWGKLHEIELDNPANTELD